MKQPHIQLEAAMGFQYAVMPGDPARLDRIAEFLENPIEMAYNREFRSLAGMYRGTRVLAISTGIGGCSTGIAVEELVKDAIQELSTVLDVPPDQAETVFNLGFHSPEGITNVTPAEFIQVTQLDEETGTRIWNAAAAFLASKGEPNA